MRTLFLNYVLVSLLSCGCTCILGFSSILYYKHYVRCLNQTCRRQDSNPRLLSKKRERYFCDLPPSSLFLCLQLLQMTFLPCWKICLRRDKQIGVDWEKGWKINKRNLKGDKNGQRPSLHSIQRPSIRLRLRCVCVGVCTMCVSTWVCVWV